VKEINIYVDKRDPFSDAQRELLRSESRYPMSWAGLRVVLNELHAFRKLAEQMRAGDFLLKFDSDVILLRRKLIDDAIGVP